MKNDLAQALLGKIMGWEGPETADHLRVLQVLARYKYDEYQRFEPGRKFIESLALWLEQFQPGEERQVAYDFIRRHLTFISDSEFAHLVESLYPDIIRPIIREQAAVELGLPSYRVSAIESSEVFARLHRQSLFLGLSDGARIDRFRRTSPGLDNEQVHATYEIAEDRRKAMRQYLMEDLRAYRAGTGGGAFRLVFLIDDFSGSGRTLLREEDGAFTGRLHRFAQMMREEAEKKPSVFAGSATRIYVCLYVATQQALEYLRDLLHRYPDPPWNQAPEIRERQVLGPNCQMTPDTEMQFDKLLNGYYNPAIEDEHTRKGGSSLVYGFANCALVLALAHNTPNNSVYLLWASAPPLVALFPRLERHR